MTAPLPQRLPLKVAAIRIAAELEALHARLERLEVGLESVFEHTTQGLEGQTIGMIQEMDMLRQSIGALADYIDHVAGTTDGDGLVDTTAAINAVPLRDMAARLSGCTAAEAETGHAELF